MKDVVICAIVAWWLIAFDCLASERPRVVHVIDSAAASEEPGVSAQLSSELRSVGFDVRESRSGESNTPAALRRAASETASIAAIAISRDGDALVARVWLTDRTTHQESLESLSVSRETAEPVRVLALRVAELLHASSLELSIATQESSATTEVEAPPEPSNNASTSTIDAPVPQRPNVESRAPASSGADSSGRHVRVASAPSVPAADRGAVASKAAANRTSTRYAVALGATALGGPGGLGASLSPALLASLRVFAPLVAELYASGPALASVREETGSADVDQEFVAARLRYDIGHGRWVPFVAGGAGAYRIGARATATDPFRATSDTAVCALAMAGGGIRFGATEDFALLGEADAIFVTPRPALRFVDDSVAKTGRPIVAFTLGAELGW